MFISERYSEAFAQLESEKRDLTDRVSQVTEQYGILHKQLDEMKCLFDKKQVSIGVPVNMMW